MNRALHNENNEEYLVIFEILAENLKCELDNVLKANHQYKTDYYRFNRKKFLLSYCFDTNNSNNEYEINTYLDEIKKISSINDYDKCFKEAHNLITSTTSFISLKSNKLLDKIKLHNQRIYNDQVTSFSNNNINNPNLHIQTQIHHVSGSQFTPVTNQFLNRNHVINNTQTTIEQPINESYFSREISFFNQVENLANNIAIETFQLADIIDAPHHSQQINTNSNAQVLHSNQNHISQSNTEKQPRRQIQLLASGKRFKCEVCAKEFKLKHQWQGHMRTHTGEKPFMCEYCGRAFSDQSSFRLHVRLKHTDRSSLKHQCEICQKKFSALSYLTKHMIYHGEKKFKCDKCDASYFMVKQLKQHSTLHTGEKPFECDVCKRKFRLSRTLKNHVQTHTEERFKCEFCDKSFKNKEYLRAHMNTHTKKNLKTCDICKKSFITNQALNNHLLLHKDERNFVCNIDGCKKAFKTPGNLSEHRMTHSKDAKKFECQICKKKFFQKSKLKRHSAKHSDVMSYECQIGDCKEKFKTSWALYQHKLKQHKAGEEFKCNECDKIFTDRTKLKRHSAVHSDVNQFECPICKEKFHTSSNLYYHKSNKHKEGEPKVQEKIRVKCDLCEKSFATKDGLKKHKTSHSEIRPFECEICEKLFKTKGQLKEHGLTHSEEAKKFQCSSCPKKFHQLSKLKRHETSHNEKYQCDVCNLTFKRSRFLSLHKKTHELTSEVVNDESIEISDEIELEHSSEQSDEEIEKIVKETTPKKSSFNKSRRKPDSPKKIRISFSKSKK